LRPKNWRELTGSGSPVFDFVFTMSDTAAGETLPEWHGQPETAHWRYADPIKAEGTELERRRPFVLILSGLERQLQIFVQLPFASLDHMALKARLEFAHAFAAFRRGLSPAESGAGCMVGSALVPHAES
jgi:arsenate reductase